MKLQYFSKAINEFYENGHDKDIHDLSSMLAEVEKYVLECYDKIDDNEFSCFKKYGATAADKKVGLRAALISEIKRLSQNIKGASNPTTDFDALKRLYDYFFDDKGNIKDKKTTTQLKPKMDFYRMRSADGYKVYDRKGIFQIAGENRKLTSKLRFSDDGHPCLYLGSSLYIAWEEVRRPSFNTVNFARFRNTRELKVIDLTVRTQIKCLTDFVMCYLCLLTSAKVEDGDKYKYRYEVSGLIMKLLQNSILRKGNVDGIKYVSSRQFDGKDIEIDATSIMQAYVFPPKESTDEGVDDWLKKVFEVSSVRTMFLYNVHQINIVNPKIAITSDYMDTLFYQLEQQLKKEKLEKIN